MGPSDGATRDPGNRLGVRRSAVVSERLGAAGGIRRLACPADRRLRTERRRAPRRRTRLVVCPARRTGRNSADGPLRRRPAGQTLWLRVYSRRVPVGWRHGDHAGARAVAAARGGHCRHAGQGDNDEWIPDPLSENHGPCWPTPSPMTKAAGIPSTRRPRRSSSRSATPPISAR